MGDATPSWINKGKNPLPDWLQPRMVGKREPNGSFMIRVRRGGDALQARVLAGNIVFEHGGEVHTCPAGEAREYVANLEREFAPVPPKPAAAFSAPRAEADVADRRDDTDDITARIRAQSSPPPPPVIPPKTAPKPPASSPGGLPLNPPRPVAKTKAAKPERTRTYPPPLGRRPMIEWIPVGELSLDASYQRSVDNQASQRLIASIAMNFDWRLCAPLIVSRRSDGTYVVIDGQHRMMGAKMRGMDDLPCCVFTYDSPEDEAKFFITANRSRKPMNRLDDFHAALAAADDDALTIQRLVTDAGLTVARNTSSTSWKPGEIAFTSSIASTLRKHGAEVAGKALKLIAEAFPGQKVVHAGSIFLGLVKILTARAAFDPDRLFRALKKYDADGWGSFVHGLKGGDTRASAIRDALLMAYEETEIENVA